MVDINSLVLTIVMLSWLMVANSMAAPQLLISREAKEVCYGDLGCFSIGKPWNSFGRLAKLPESPEKINTKFLLLTRRNTEEPHRIIAGKRETLDNSLYNKANPVKFIAHGYLHSGSTPWLKKMAQYLLRKGDFNVFLIDWGEGSRGLYRQPVANTRVVAAETAKLIRFLSNCTGLKHDDVHVIGHSLGAEVAGYVGYALGDLGRITGLDPAGPYFENQDPLVRLDETDAKFVDVIHTDASSIANFLRLEGGFGTWQPSGHVDVYVNGGKKQPGCDDSLFERIDVEGSGDGLVHFIACYHYRAFEIATDSVTSLCPFRAYLCEDWDEFKTGRCLRCPSDGRNGTWCNGVGLTAFKPTDGSFNRMYWMATNTQPPFCLYHYQVRLTLTQNTNKEQKGKVWFRLVGNKNSNDLFIVNDGKHFSLKAGATIDFLVTSSTDLGDVINSVEVQWEHDPSWFDISDWFVENPDHRLFLEKVTVFSGERQNEVSFCDRSGKALESKHALSLSSLC